MTDRNTAGGASDTAADVIARLAGNAEKLEIAIEQSLAALRKRGLQLPIDLGGMARGVRTDIMTLRKTGPDASKLQQLEELVRTSALINSSLDLNQVLEDVIDTIIALTQAERAYLMLRDQETGELSIRTARNWDRETLAGNAAVYSRSVINIAIEQGSPVLTTNAQGDERFQGAMSIVMHELRSILCIPLVQRGQTVGVLYVDNRIGAGNFNQDIIPIMAAFANQAAIAIENARSFGQVKADLDQAKSEVENLRIQIDQRRLETQLGEITETEYFQNLQSIAAGLRNRTRRTTS